VKTFEAPGHFKCTNLRVHHRDTGGPQNFSVGLSHFLPGGGIEMSGTATEKVYIVLSGSLTVQAENGQEFVLGPMESLFIPNGEKRSLMNKTNLPATMLVVVSYPK
jgi:quercetin dioxygenase-like cupin family protein